MARRARGQDTRVSLFPFLSVLACIIGALTLLLAAVAVGSMGGESVEQLQLNDRMQAAEIFLAGGRARLEELDAQLTLQKEQVEAQEELGRRLSALGLSPDISLAELEAQVDLETQLAKMQEQRAGLAKRLAVSKEDVERLEQTVSEKRARRASSPILIDPSGIGREFRPFLVESRAEYVELHRSKGDWSYRIASDQLAHSEPYRKFLRRVRVIHDALLIFLIRPDGVETFLEAQAIANQYGVRNAKLPLPGSGQLDLTLLGEEAQ